MKFNSFLNKQTIKQLQKKGMLALLQGKFQESFKIYEIAYWQDTQDLDSLIGLYLSDIGIDYKYEALNIFDLYQNAIKSNPKSQKKVIQSLILDLIKELDNKINADMSETERREKLVMDSYDSLEDSISFQDLQLILEKNDFKEIFNYILTNTKLIFYKKSDFYEFLSLLIKNDYLDMSMHYIDNLPKYDEDIVPIIEAANEKLRIRSNLKELKNTKKDKSKTD